MATLPTGEQYDLTLGDQRCTVTEQGATLRAYSVAGRDVVLPFGPDEQPTGCQGQQLLPWPNRIRDGRYRFEGADQQLPINEIDRGTALHGLVAWVPWILADQTPSSVTQRVQVLSQPGWPGVLEATVTHTLTERGLVVQVSARNTGAGPVPYGYAAHPYFVLDAPIDEWTVTLPFDRWLEVEPDRLLPVAVRPVEGTDQDFRAGRTFGTTVLDTAFTGASPGQDDWRVVLQHGPSRVEVWADSPLPWLQVYTPGDRASLAVEPMTCGPDCFNEGPTHDDLVVLQPGQTLSLRWGVTATVA